MTSVQKGRQAEAAVVNYLLYREFTIVAKNWRNRFCEIDIIARRQQTIYFIEVKYRRNSGAGSPLEAVNPRKYRRMFAAAQRWIASNNWQGQSALMAIAVAGPKFTIVDYLTFV